MSVLWLEVEGIVEYSFIPTFNNIYINILILYFITVGSSLLIAHLFKVKK